MKWAIELSEFDIEFKLRTAIKAQALADFIVKLTTPLEQPMGQKANWKIFVDRSSNGEVSRVGIIMIGPNFKELEYSLHLVINNDVEYEAIIAGLGLSTRLEMSLVEIYIDSRLIVGR